MHQATFGYIIRQKAKYYPDDAAIVDGDRGEAYTYETLERRSSSIAWVL